MIQLYQGHWTIILVITEAPTVQKEALEKKMHPPPEDIDNAGHSRKPIHAQLMLPLHLALELNGDTPFTLIWKSVNPKTSLAYD